MTIYTSPYTGNTSYRSDDGMFSSMSRKWVETWERENVFKEYVGKPHIRFFWDNKGNTEQARNAIERAKKHGHGWV